MEQFSIFSEHSALTQGKGYKAVDFSALFPDFDAVSGARKFRARAYITTKDARSMRFRWNEINPRRDAFFASLGISFPGSPPLSPGGRRAGKFAVPIELLHSKTVLAASSAGELALAQGDGVLASDSSLVPVITVADCLPVFLAHPRSGCFGVVHSGWKGTGIVLEALRLAEQTWGADAAGFFAFLGPHIGEGCYTVEEERADFFSRTFTPDCVSFDKDAGTYHLSLDKANVFLLKKGGVPETRIALSTDCTACDTRLGSYRREASRLDLPREEQLKRFTAMAAFMSADDSYGPNQ